MSTTKPLNEKSKKLHYYTEVFENTSDVIYLMEVTPDGEFIYLDINKAYTEVTGIPKESVIGLNVEKIENEAFRAILIDKFTACLNAGEKTNYIADYPFPAGVRVFHSTLSPMFDESGRMHRIVGIARDITEYKRQNEQLALKDQEFRSLADNSPDVIVRYDAELNRTYSNPSWDRISAISSVGVLGEPTIEKTARPSHMATTYEMNLKKVLENRESGDVELTLMDENDKPLFFTQRLVPEYDSKGNAIGVLTIARDITPYKKLQETLKSREREFRSLAENQPENIARWDTQGRYLYINPTHEQTLGRPLAEVIGTRVPNEHTAVKEAIAQVAATGQKVLVHQKVQLKNGEKMIHDVTIAPEFDSAGRLVSILGIGRDMSEHYKQERLLRQSEARFRHFFERQLVGMAITSPTHGWIQSNEKLQQMLGYTHEELTQMTWAEMTHPDDILADMEQFNRLLAAEIDDYMLEKRFIRKDGAVIYTKLAISCVRQKDQTIDYVLVLIEDITDKKKGELALRESQERLQTIIENEPECIKIIDGEGKLLYMNPAGLDMIEATLEQVNGKEVLGVIVEEYRDSFVQMHRRVMAGEKVHLVFETVGLRGKHCWLETTSVPMQMDGKTVLLGVTRDITERKKAEEALAMREREFRSLAENSPNIIIRYDLECRRIYVNPAFSKHTGIPLELAINAKPDTQWDSYINMVTMTASEYQEKIQSVIRSGESANFLTELFKYIDGEYKAHDVHIVAERDTNGAIIGALVIGHDITEQKRMENELNSSEEKYRTFFESANDGIFLHRIVEQNDSVEFILHDLNQRGCELWDHSREDILSGNLDLLTIGEHPYTFEEATKRNRLAANGEPQLFDWQIKHKDGSILCGEVNLRRIQIGNEPFLLAIIRNITERKQQEERLHKTKAKLAAIISTIPDLIWVKDAEGTYMMCNPAFENFFGASCEEIIGKTDYDFISREQADFFRQKDIEALEAGEILINEEEVIFAHNGQYALLETRKVPVYNGEDFMGVLGIGRDITEKKKAETALKESIEFSEEIINTIPDLLFELDAEGTYLNIWAQDERLLTEQKAILIGNNIRDILPHDAVEVSFQTMREVDETGLSLGNIMSVELAEGRKYFELSASKRLSSGTYIVLSRDITDRKRLEQKILTNQSRLNEAQKIAQVGSWELTFPGLHLTWSDEIYRIFEIDPELYEPSYDHFLNAIHPDDRELVDRVYAESLTDKAPYEVTHRLLMSDGRIKYVHEKGETFYDAEGNPIRSIGTVQDITKQKSVEKKIEHMAHHDALTGLPNRILAKERAEQILTNAKRTGSKAAFLFIDLDGFKSINDSLGHSTGDAMLKIITTRLKECVRECDMISRQGGDEFLLILSDVTGEKDISIIVDKVLSELEKPLEIATHTLSISGSIGIALYPDHGESFETLLQCADTAMYKAKDLGKNGYCFYTQQMNHNLIGQFKIQNDLKNALQNGEFVLHYQPQIDLSSNTIIGAEALIRWRHPQLGMIPPMSFIPIAESSGLIVPIGQWVIEEACAQAARWNAMGITITIAVNISAMQFKRGNLESVVANALAESKIDPHYLELELTESIIMHDTENTLQYVRNLKSLGVQLSIDDFGTGYSSLAYLKRFAVDKLKIDQSFIRDILQDQEDAVIVSTIVQMAKNLNLKTIAEGVETQEIVELITSYGCDEVQGYHYAKPLEAPDFETFHASFGREII